MALFLSLVSLFRNNSNNNNNNNNNNSLKKNYISYVTNFQFKVSEVKINTQLLDTILSEHLI